ncbi:increased DNA methylation 1-like [Pistacia vera]|uniref:increased DNA methylation 1-like n=1 Tax=Pistacia vera TaxID=55513 RepID=UPI001262F2B0|nr:increased DNA methylation 1-like [Pistacia vera]
MMRRRKHLENSRVDIGGRRFLGPMAMGRSGIESQFNTSSSRNVVDKRKNLFLERTSSFNQGGMNRFGMDRDAGRMPISLLREKYLGDSDEPIRLQGKNGVLKVMVNKKKKMGEPVKKYDHLDTEENLNSFRDSNRNVPIRPPSYLETEVLEKPSSFVRTEKNHINLQKSLSAKKSKDADSDSDDSDTALKLGPKRTEARKSLKEVSSESEKTPAGKLTLTGTKEGKVRRGSGTEKQKLREKIRGMLVEAGWTIDYRPRRNRDYLDAVYINPSGTAYWSIIKAYDALLKQLNDEEEEVKPPLSDEVLSQLTRKTRKKIEKELKKKQRDGSQSVNTREAAAKKSSSARHDEESMGSISHEEKLSSFLKQGGKSSKSRMNENGVASQNSKGQSSTHHLHDGDEKPSSASNSHLLHGRKSRKLGRCTLLVRSSNGGPNSETDGFVPYAGKRTLLSWLIDSGTVQLSQKVQYMNRRRTKVMLEGWITRDGIHCGCCSKILTVSKFEIHAGSKLRQPFQNIYLDSGDSLLQCQIDAWNRQEDSERIGFDSVDIDGDDPNDDTCGICGDGGDLICCDGCPSTFHQNCLDIQMLPAGDWHCPNCTCKFCGSAGEDIDEGSDVTTCSLLTCSMCEKKYHKLCMHDMDAVPVYSNCSVTFFCGQTCRELFEHLQKYLGVKQELESGFSWSLIHRTGEDSDTMLRGLPQRVESNSKLAVALTVMDECFLPIVDRRSGVNLIHNVLYNSGSNFNRLNFSGFYTAILERGDEIISAASIRFHGTQLAEMPFIGTRHIYRRQGMCRRLFCALESALCSLKVEKLVIPAIAELMHTWTGIFGFTPLEESLKQETRSLNMLVFPGIDMLQKLLLEEESVTENMKARTGSQKTESEAKAGVTPEVANESNIDSLAELDPDKCADSGLIHANLINGEVAATDSDSKCPDVSLNGTSVLSGSSEGPTNVLVEGTPCPDSQSGDKLAESASDGKCLSNSDTSNDEFEMRNKEVDMDVVHAVDVTVSASHEVEIPVSAVETVSPNSQLGDKSAESASAKNCLSTAGISHYALEKGNKPELNSAVEDNAEFSTDSDVDDAHAVAANSATSHEVEVSVEETLHPGSDLGSKSAGFASERKTRPAPGISADAMDMENNQLSDSPLQDNLPSCKEGDTNDACSIDVNQNSSHSPSEDNIQSQKEGNPDNLDDKVAHPDSAPCPGDITAENTTEASIEISVDARSSMQITTDSNDHVTCEKVHKLVSSEDACEATVCEESSVHPCSNGVQNACA